MLLANTNSSSLSSSTKIPSNIQNMSNKPEHLRCEHAPVHYHRQDRRATRKTEAWLFSRMEDDVVFLHREYFTAR
jgi:hypothetical protein